MKPETMDQDRVRLAYVVSHPIQYQASLLRRIACEPGIDLTVFFCSDFSVRSYNDEGFGVAVEWDVPLLGGYKHVFLKRWRDTHSPVTTRPISRGFLRHFKGGGPAPAFDAVWVHGYSAINALHAIGAAKVLGIPVLVRAEPWLRDRVRAEWKLAAKRGFFKLLRRGIDATLPIGSLNREYWRAYLGHDFPMFDMPYAVDNAYFQQRAQAAAAGRSALQAELGLDANRPVILFASKLQTRKHCDHLLEAYLRMASRAGADPRPYLVIVGDGEERVRLQTTAEASGCRSIRFAGFRNQSELPRFFDLASVFVLPSRHEAWGLIVNEVMNAGRAVIVSDDVGSGPDLVRDGENGYIYPAGNVAALEHALRSVLASPEIAARMGERSLELIAGWDYEADVRGLRQALAHVTKKLPPRQEGQ